MKERTLREVLDEARAEIDALPEHIKAIFERNRELRMLADEESS